MLCTMLRFLCKRFSLAHFETQKSSTVHTLKSLKFLSAVTSNSDIICITSSKTQKVSFTVNDLIKSGSLSHEFLSRSNSSGRPNAVIKFLQSYGFSQTQVEGIVSKDPNILFFDARKTLEPKFCFFRSLGMSEFDVANMFSTCPHLLRRGLKNYLIPAVDLLSTFFGEQHLVEKLKHCPYFLRGNVANITVPNMSLLRDNGIPISQISKMMNNLRFVKVLITTKPDRFNKIVSDLIGMGFNLRSSYFESAIYALCSETGWELKLKLFQNLGFAKEETLSMFRKQPLIMCLSEKKIREMVEFYVKRFLWSPSQLSVTPNVLLYSLEKRIIPRCSVLQVLASRNRIQNCLKLISLLSVTEKEFLCTYVNKYMEEIPEVLDAYKGKLEFDEYNWDSGKTGLVSSL